MYAAWSITDVTYPRHASASSPDSNAAQLCTDTFSHAPLHNVFWGRRNSELLVMYPWDLESVSYWVLQVLATRLRALL